MQDANRDRFLSHYGALRRLARDIVLDEHEADDVVQDVWLAVEESRGVRDWAAWLRVVTRHAALRAKARGTRRQQVREFSVPSDPDESAEERAAQAELRDLLQRIVGELDEPYRTVVRGRYLEGLGFDELARTLGTSPATVRSQVHRGLARLRDELDRRHDGERMLWGAAFLRAFQLDGEGERARVATSTAGRGAALAAMADPRVWVGAALVVLGAIGWFALRGGTRPADDVVAGSEHAGSTRLEERVAIEPVRSPAGTREPAAPSPSPEPEPSRGVQLRVVDELGTPVQGARVHLGTPRGRGERRGATDAEGRFELRRPEEHEAHEDRHFGNYALGEAFLAIEMDGMQSSPYYYFDWESAAGQLLEVRLVRGDSRLHGRIVDEERAGIGGVRVGLGGGRQVAPRVEGPFRIVPYSTMVTTAPDGSFQIVGLAPTAQSILADHPEYVLGSQNYPAEAWLASAEVEIVLERGVVLRGTVQDEAQVPIEGAVVRLWRWTEGAPRTATTDSDGSFRLSGLPRAPVRLFASSEIGPTGRAHASTAIDLRAAEPATWTATLAPSGDIRFELVDSSDEPLEGWRVELATASRDWFAAVTSGPDGVTSPLGDWPRETLALHVYRSGAEEAFPVHVVDAWTPTAGRMRCVVDAARSEPAEIRGSVRMANGEPFPALRVLLSSLASGMVTQPAVDGGTGGFAVDCLPAGEYLVLANTPNGQANLARVSVLAGESRDLGILRAPGVGWLTVEIDTSPQGELASYLLYVDWPDREGVKSQAIIGGRGVPTRKELIAGTYEVEMSIGSRIDRERFQVRPGEEVVVRIGREKDAD